MVQQVDFFIIIIFFLIKETHISRGMQNYLYIELFLS